MNLNDYISNDEVIELSKKLISIESHKDNPIRESKVAEYINQLLINENIETELDLIEENRPNVYGYIIGENPSIELMLNGHIDTIPGFNMDYEPFKPFIKDGKIFGRGSADMKSGIAAFLSAMIALKRSGKQLKNTLMFAGVIGEEERSKGTERLVKNKIFAKNVVIAEPTDLKVSVTHKGMEWIEIEFLGKSTHGSRPHEGINSIYMASEFCSLIINELQPKIESNSFDMLGNGTINVGVIKGGNDPNIVPDSCTIQIDRRWLPNEKLSESYEELELIADKVINKFGGTYKIRGMRELTASMTNAPHSIDVNDPLVKEALKSTEKFTLEKQLPRDFPAWSDAGILSNHTDAKSIILGPGHINQAHANDEFCDISQIIAASNIYLDLIEKFCI